MVEFPCEFVKTPIDILPVSGSYIIGMAPYVDVVMYGIADFDGTQFVWHYNKKYSPVLAVFYLNPVKAFVFTASQLEEMFVDTKTKRLCRVVIKEYQA